MKFMLMMHAPRGNTGDYQASNWSPDDLKAHIGFMHELNRDLVQAGELVGAEGLAPPGDARVVRHNKNGVPAGEVLDVPSVLEHPQIVGRGLLSTFDDVSEVDRTVSVVRSGFRLASGDPKPASPPPALGADTARLLAELGYSESDIETLARDKAI